MGAEIAAAAAGLAAGALGVLALRPRVRRDAVAALSVPATVAPLGNGTIERVLRALPFAAFFVDPRGRVTYVNPAAEALFGVSALRSTGRVLIEVVPSVEFERQVNDALAGNSSTRDVRVVGRDHERILGITVERLDPGGVIAIAVDRTELVSMERIRRDFVSNVSHELRTPLAAIKLMIETMIAAQDDADAREQFMPRVAAEVDRIVKLVEDLLAMARSESGRLVIRRDRFDLTDVAASVVDTFSHRAASVDVSLDLEAPEAVFVEADRDRLAQVAVNLVDNALRHTPAAGTVTVEVAGEDEWAVLRVRDTGAGIAHADLAHVFDRFYVADRSRSRGQSGTGLGLSIARNLVEAHGGKISAESILGRGATFTCRLPRAANGPPDRRLRNLKVDLSNS